MQLFLEHGADLKLKDKTHGADALTVAAANGRTSAALLLLNKGANPRSADATGKTPLMWAAKNGHADTLKLILDHGGELAAKDGDGKTAAVLAKESKQSAVEAFIKSTAAGS
jgi:ankyrin repeat protein